MAALTATRPTLADWAKSLDPDGGIADIIEVLNQTNEINEDGVHLEGNLPTGHRTTIRTGIPTPTFRKLYGGVQPTKATQIQVTDNCGMLEDYSEIDVALAKLNANAAAFRYSQDIAHIEGMGQKVAYYTFYGNESTEPEAFTGIAPRFNSLSAENACNVLSASGSTNVTSIYLIGWGANTCHYIFPKGSTVGLSKTDLGEVTVENIDGSNGRMQAYRTHFQWNIGLSVPDWRYVVRIANIDYTALTKAASSGADLIDLMAQAIELIPSLGLCSPVFYCNRTVKSFLRRQIANKVASSTLTMDAVAGKHVLSFDGIPVKRCDKISLAETAVS